MTGHPKEVQPLLEKANTRVHTESEDLQTTGEELKTEENQTTNVPPTEDITTDTPSTVPADENTAQSVADHSNVSFNESTNVNNKSVDNDKGKEHGNDVRRPPAILIKSPKHLSKYSSEGVLVVGGVECDDSVSTPELSGTQPFTHSRQHRRSHSDSTNNPQLNNGIGEVSANHSALQVPLSGCRGYPSLSLCRRIRIEEVVPSTSSYIGVDKEEKKKPDWRSNLDNFTSKRLTNMATADRAKMPRSVRRYYETQDELITAFENLHLDLDDAMDNTENQRKLTKRSTLMAKVSFVCNLFLLIIKSVAAAMSGSLAVISSVIDSAVDLASGGLMWWSNRAVKNRNIYEYPQGRTRLEPVAIVILSVIMSLASVQMIVESVQRIVHYAQEKGAGPVFGLSTIIICTATVVIKLVLWLVCRRIQTPSCQALAQDHRNDVLSNTVAIGCGLIGDRLWAFADPIGAVIISLYIFVSWCFTGWEQIKMLTGVTARPEFLKKITWIAVNHHASVLLIDTVRAFHFGNNFLVEVDIVLPEDMSLRVAHDIGESLQLKIERLPEVERAFVHLDYETDHSPFSEHKQV